MGKNTDNPTCKLCGEAHRIEPGKVCPKFRSKKIIAQPEPKRLAPPKPVGDGVALTSIAHPKPKRAKKAPRDISKASIETIPAPPSIIAAIKAKAFDRAAYQREYMKDSRAADKLGITVKELRARQKQKGKT